MQVATLWVSPSSPRVLDAPALRDVPDMRRWLSALDAEPADDGRLGLHGRVETQLLAGEPVVIEAVDGQGWLRVRALWQPWGTDEHGYAGWVRRAHVIADDTLDVIAAIDDPEPLVDPPHTREQFVDLARRHIGTPYLWGGLGEHGVDCSGLVHLTCRDIGVVIPRDADDQQTICRPVTSGQERTGDLYFFAHPGQAAHHVGIVTEPGHMLHAPQTGARVIEEALTAARAATLVGVGRLPCFEATAGEAVRPPPAGR